MKMMDRTGADGVMIARYGMENPMIFSELTGKETGETKYSLMMEQINIAQSCFDETAAMDYIRKLASYFMKKIPGTKALKQEMYMCGNMQELRNVTAKIFGETEKQDA